MRLRLRPGPCLLRLRALVTTCHSDTSYAPAPSHSHAHAISHSPRLVAWRKSESDNQEKIPCERSEVVSNNRMPRRTMSLSPGWRLGESFDSNVYTDIHTNRNDEVELFLEKYVLPLQDSCSEYDSGHHSFDTSSADSSDKTAYKENRIHKHKIKQKKKESRSQLVTIVSINGEVTTFRTVCKKMPEKQVKISRSKTLPSSMYKNSLKVTVNGAGCFDFKEEF